MWWLHNRYYLIWVSEFQCGSVPNGCWHQLVLPCLDFPASVKHCHHFVLHCRLAMFIKTPCDCSPETNKNKNVHTPVWVDVTISREVLSGLFATRNASYIAVYICKTGEFWHRFCNLLSSYSWFNIYQDIQCKRHRKSCVIWKIICDYVCTLYFISISMILLFLFENDP